MLGLRPLLRTPLLGFGLGALAGGFEAAALGATLDLALTWPEALALAGAAVGLGGLLGVLLGVPAGVVADLATRSWYPPRRYAAGMVLTAALLGCWYLWPLGLHKLDQGLVPAALAFALTPIGVAGVVWFNALYWFRREDIGEERRLGWWFFGPLLGLVVAGGGAWTMAQRTWGSARALADDPAVVVISVDGWRAGAPDTPGLDALAAAGLRFDTAISPVPDPVAAQAALLTGRHPVRCGVLGPQDTLQRGYDTVAEVFEGEGYATGAFAARPALDGRGLDQGFAAFDAEPPLPLAGLAHVRSVALGLRALRALAPAAVASLERRDDAETADRALAWLAAVGDRPALLWVSLAGPAEAPAAELAAATTAADARVTALVEGVRAWAGGRPLLLVVVGATGRDDGAHGEVGGAPTLWDPAVRVPLVILPPSMRGVKYRELAQQVRLMDVPATLLSAVHLDPMEHSEGVDLVGFAQATRSRHYASLLVDEGADGDLLLGYRAARAGDEGTVKFLLDPASGARHLYDLDADPGETKDLADQQPEAVAAVEAQVRQEAAALLAGR